LLAGNIEKHLSGIQMQLQSPYEAYQLYVAIKNHFHTTYDFFKYGGKVKTQFTTFEVRKDKYFFSKLQRHSDPVGLLVSHFIDNPDSWIGDIVNMDVSEDVYLKWKRRQDSISYIYKEDLKKLNEDLDTNLVVVNGQHPKLLKMYLGNTIYPETVILLNFHLNFLPYWEIEITDPAIWPVTNQKLQKYKPFIKFNKQVTKKTTVDYFGI
jgi:hypothetical protein